MFTFKRLSNPRRFSKLTAGLAIAIGAAIGVILTFMSEAAGSALPL